MAEKSEGLQSTRTFVSNPNYNEKASSTLAAPFIQVRSNDDEQDGFPDSYDLEISVSGVETQNIWHFFLGLVFNYTLSDVIATQMQSLALIEARTATGVSWVEASGSLLLKQHSPLYDVTYTTKLDYDENPLGSISNWTLGYLLEEYNQRNETTVFDGDIVVMPYGDPNSLFVKVHLEVPKFQWVEYMSGILEGLKYAWI